MKNMQEVEKQKKRKPNTQTVRKYHGLCFTREQKLVATVWYHERSYTGISFDQLCQNFLTRFHVQYPAIRTLHRWEKRLFKEEGDIEKRKISEVNFSRWVYIPYIKDSLIRNPDMTVKARSQYLGISTATLHRILKIDMKGFRLKKNKIVDVAKKTDGDDKDNEVKDTTTK